MLFCLLSLHATVPHRLLGRRQANLCFHFAGSGENLPDIAKSRDASLDFAPHPDEAEQLPVLSHKLPFFS